jgi:hypothetical protein
VKTHTIVWRLEILLQEVRSNKEKISELAELVRKWVEQLVYMLDEPDIKCNEAALKSPRRDLNQVIIVGPKTGCKINQYCRGASLLSIRAMIDLPYMNLFSQISWPRRYPPTTTTTTKKIPPSLPAIP